jgi:hypothetical protein
MSQVLKNILNEAATASANNEKFLAVFDLDSTLFDLKPRHQKILQRFYDDPEMQKRFSKECQILSTARFEPKDWGISEALNRAGLDANTHSHFWSDIHDHWNYWFFHNHFLREDRPLPGAVEFVTRLENSGAEIMYLTGRDHGRMWEGTLASLTHWKFPVKNPATTIRLKPEPCMDDAKFKLKVLEKLANSYNRIYLFENEPVNLNLVKKCLPQVQLVFVDTVHSGREQFEGELANIPHFEVSYV